MKRKKKPRRVELGVGLINWNRISLGWGREANAISVFDYKKIRVRVYTSEKDWHWEYDWSQSQSRYRHLRMNSRELQGRRVRLIAEVIE